MSASRGSKMSVRKRLFRARVDPGSRTRESSKLVHVAARCYVATSTSERREREGERERGEGYTKTRVTIPVLSALLVGRFGKTNARARARSCRFQRTRASSYRATCSRSRFPRTARAPRIRVPLAYTPTETAARSIDLTGKAINVRARARGRD